MTLPPSFLTELFEEIDPDISEMRAEAAICASLCNLILNATFSNETAIEALTLRRVLTAAVEQNAVTAELHAEGVNFVSLHIADSTFTRSPAYNLDTLSYRWDTCEYPGTCDLEMPAHNLGTLSGLLRCIQIIVENTMVSEEAMPVVFAWIGAEIERNRPGFAQRTLAGGIALDHNTEGLISKSVMTNPILISLVDAIVASIPTEK
jgi:hypothetical protein